MHVGIKASLNQVFGPEHIRFDEFHWVVFRRWDLLERRGVHLCRNPPGLGRRWSSRTSPRRSAAEGSVRLETAAATPTA